MPGFKDWKQISVSRESITILPSLSSSYVLLESSNIDPLHSLWNSFQFDSSLGSSSMVCLAPRCHFRTCDYRTRTRYESRRSNRMSFPCRGRWSWRISRMVVIDVHVLSTIWIAKTSYIHLQCFFIGRCLRWPFSIVPLINSKLTIALLQRWTAFKGREDGVGLWLLRDVLLFVLACYLPSSFPISLVHLITYQIKIRPNQLFEPRRKEVDRTETRRGQHGRNRTYGRFK